MLRLNLSGRPEVVTLSGATLECKALDYGDVIIAMAEMQPDDTLFEQVAALGGVVITGWTGIHDATGAPLAFDPALVPALMRQPQVWSPFWEQYARRAMNMAREGNGSAPSADGTPVEESGSAEGASTSTGRGAGRARSGSARQTTTGARLAGSKPKKAPGSRG